VGLSLDLALLGSPASRGPATPQAAASRAEAEGLRAQEGELKNAAEAAVEAETLHAQNAEAKLTVAEAAKLAAAIASLAGCSKDAD